MAQLILDGYSERERTDLGPLGYCVECQDRLRLHNMGEDGRCAACTWPEMLAKKRRLRQLEVTANASADQCIRVMNMAGHWREAFGFSVEEIADFAAKAAVACYKACKKYEDEDGHPAGEGEG